MKRYFDGFFWPFLAKFSIVKITPDSFELELRALSIMRQKYLWDCIWFFFLYDLTQLVKRASKKREVLYNFWLTNLSLLFEADASGISLKISCKKWCKISQSKICNTVLILDALYWKEFKCGFKIAFTPLLWNCEKWLQNNSFEELM